MRAAVISDVHGNLPALMSVWEDIKSQGVSMIWCLGDTIGYGADPWECWRIVESEMKATMLRGNHDEALVYPKRFNFRAVAEAGVSYARATAPVGANAKIEALPPMLELPEFDVALAHGSLTGDHYIYVVSARDAAEELRQARYSVNIVGHTHEAMCVDDRGVWTPIGDKPLYLSLRNKYLINPGSVGQPRDGDSRAAYGVLEVTRYQRSFTWRRVSYPIFKAAEAIQSAGLPHVLGQRLFKGK